MRKKQAFLKYFTVRTHNHQTVLDHLQISCEDAEYVLSLFSMINFPEILRFFNQLLIYLNNNRAGLATIYLFIYNIHFWSHISV